MECPICFEQMSDNRGARTKLYAFDCAHAVCCACDKRMFRGIDDRCPTCRAPRDVAGSVARHGQRPIGTPVHQRTAPALDGGGGGGGAQTMFFPMDDGRPLRVFVDGNVPVAEVPAALNHFLSVVSTMPSLRRFRLPPSITEDAINDATAGDDDDDVEAAADIARATINSAIEADEGIQAAVDGLMNVHETSIGSFVQRVHGRPVGR